MKLIKNKKDYQQALTRLEDIFDAKKGTPEGDELEVLGLLIEQYENEHFPIDLPDPIEAIKFRMEQLGYTNSDLANIIGLKSRASEILNKKRNRFLSLLKEDIEVMK
jgi:HTH-type transcriptional regulator/antitoxin HigA